MFTPSMYPNKLNKYQLKENNSKYIRTNPTSMINIYVLNPTNHFVIILQPPKSRDLHWEQYTVQKSEKPLSEKQVLNMNQRVDFIKKSRVSQEKCNLKVVINIKLREWQAKAHLESYTLVLTEIMEIKSQLKKFYKTKSIKIEST